MTDLERFRKSMTYQPRDKARFHECPWPTQKGDRLRPRGDYFALGSDGDVNLLIQPWIDAGIDISISVGSSGRNGPDRGSKERSLDIPYDNYYYFMEQR